MQQEHIQEIRKLVNVLRRMAHLVRRVSWSAGAYGAPSQEQTARYCAQQYNRIFSRLKELDPAVGHVFGPLDETTSLDAVGIACIQLAAYYEEELRGEEGEGRRHRYRDWGSFYETVYETGPFKIFLGRGFRDLEELGRLIRECMPPWMRGQEPGTKSEAPKSSTGGHSEEKG